MKLTRGLCSVSGEYHVCAELSRRGFIAALTLKNAEGTDVLAARPNLGHTISIQVKTTQGTKTRWMLNKKCELNGAANFFFIFVHLKDEMMRPDFYVVPSIQVAKGISVEHKKWIEGTKRNGTARKNTTMRAFIIARGEYLEDWQILR